MPMNEYKVHVHVHLSGTNVGSGPKIGPFCARNDALCTNHPLVAHSALCVCIETGVHILPLVALCLYMETGVHILPLMARSALLPIVAYSALCTELYLDHFVKPFLVESEVDHFWFIMKCMLATTFG